MIGFAGRRALAVVVAGCSVAVVVAGTGAASPRSALDDKCSRPAITGTAQEGESLTVSAGAWSGATPINFAFRWQRCDTGGNNCSYIIGANDQTYRLSSADVGNTLRGEVTAKNNAGSATATSPATAVIRASG